ncbi:MAG: aminotransferase class V-fold PLP-dependent enzyme, partial [Spirochaetes bacterium]|nr:aminotransferase class V-fold PLP-dependent enzyme [Spirochaetota bacterium]
MPEKKASDFRYSTGETKVPWDAVGENYNTADILQVIRFLVKGEGDTYESLLSDVGKKVDELFKYGVAPGKLSLGDKVSELEDKIDAFLHTSGSTFIANATAGFEIAYRYANLKEGDEVIIPAITFIATMSYPLAVGVKVVLADVDPRTINIDPKDVEKKITEKTKMVVPVHIGGWPVDMDPLM